MQVKTLMALAPAPQEYEDVPLDHHAAQSQALPLMPLSKRMKLERRLTGTRAVPKPPRFFAVQAFMNKIKQTTSA